MKKEKNLNKIVTERVLNVADCAFGTRQVEVRRVHDKDYIFLNRDQDRQIIFEIKDNDVHYVMGLHPWNCDNIARLGRVLSALQSAYHLECEQ